MFIGLIGLFCCIILFIKHVTIGQFELLVKVENSDKAVLSDVLTYEVVPEKRDSEDIPPTEEYMNLLIRNAKEHGFPGEYIEYLEQVEVIEV